MVRAILPVPSHETVVQPGGWTMIEQVWAWGADVAVRSIHKIEWILQTPNSAASLIGSSLTAFGLFFTGFQIVISRFRAREELQWKRSEVVRSHLAQMVNDPNIAVITRVLDWRGGPARIPEQFQPLFDVLDRAPTPPEWHAKAAARTYFEIDWGRFVRSLAIRRDMEWRNADMFMYRTCFDAFCTFLQGVADDVRSIGVDEAEYADLSFYCHRVVFPRDGTRSPDERAGVVMRDYIKEYYNERTYLVIVRHAEVYAKTHQNNQPMPSRVFPELFERGSMLKRLFAKGTWMTALRERWVSLGS
ncbi:hypothetical protein [uncultured Sphingomonas sp.]|uniref:hypothetical protein n=1 Tax=uncultured Sphingomonas sp. TaxID=158754 RepID=UPI002587EE56|nr:hypothetical protein [uncultured Sphingomonas sp.]